jgi:ATP-dependent 26S proteasome regulatory subunit
MTDRFNDLEVLIDSQYPVICIETHEESRAEEILTRISRCMRLPFFHWVATQGLTRSGEPQPVYNTITAMEVLNFISSSSLDAVYLLKDLHRYLEDPILVRKLRDICQCFRQKRKSLVLTAPSFSMPPELTNEVVFFDLSLPSSDELKELVRRVVRDISTRRKITVTMDSATGRKLVQNLKGLTLNEAERVLTRAIVHDGMLSADDLPRILDVKKQKISQSGLIEFFPRQDSFEGIGGLKKLKQWLGIRKGAFSEEAKSFGIDPPRGVLLLGIQGCGKSLMAKAVAQEWELPLLRLDTGSLYSKFIGETETNVREAIRLAESMAPVVLWIDEIEKAFTPPGGSDADGGVSARLLGTFLSWMQEKKASVFVVATANNIHMLPPELLRKGRFDEIFFMDLPRAEERAEIFRLHLQRRKRDPSGFDLGLLSCAAEGFSGAEIEQGIVSALYAAFSARRDLCTDCILQELKSTRPLSLVMKEQIDQMRAWADGRTVSAA